MCSSTIRSLQQLPIFRLRSMAPSVKSANKKAKTDPAEISMTSNTTSVVDGAGVQPGRIRVLKEGDPSRKGPVVYWMFRDQRSRDNWALIHAVDQARRTDTCVAVAFNLFDQFLGAKARQLGFMVRGLQELEQNLRTMEIPFFLFKVLKYIFLKGHFGHLKK